MRILALSIALFGALSSQAALITPQQAVSLAVAKPLQFVGKYTNPNSSSGTTKNCVFRNDLVTVVYDYCAKKEIPALSFRIYPVGANSGFHTYAEGKGDPSQIRRDQYYDVYWRVTATLNLPSFRHDMTLAEHSKYEALVARQSGCSVFYMENRGNIEMCFDPAIKQDEGAAWLIEAAKFWDAPTEDWYKLQKALRSIVESNK